MGERKRKRDPQQEGENVVVAFNALLTSLDAKLPTSRFTADELRISNRQGRQPCRKLHSSRRRSCSVVSTEPACIRISFVHERNGRGCRGGKRRWELTATPVCNETFSCSVSFSTMWLVPFPGWHDAPRMVLVVFYCERPQHNSLLATVFCHVTSHIVSYQ